MKTTLVSLILGLSLVLAACSSSSSSNGPTPPAAEPVGEVPALPPTDTVQAELPGQGQPCQDGQCAEGIECMRYYGIAGPRGPEFTSCEISCQGGAACPKGQSCVTVADGPGQVCRSAAP